MSSWPKVQRFMLQHCGVVMRDEQEYLLEARLLGVAKQFSFASVGEYVSASCARGARPEYMSALVDAMTTHETMFFRDAGFWTKLERELLPTFEARSTPLRVWSAACSTGQEIYSLAMLLRDRFPSLYRRAELIATDVSEETVERARKGVFSSMEVQRGLSLEQRGRHFQSTQDGFQISSELREQVRFSVQNLVAARDTGPADCDIVMCRNVLIYFEEREKRQAVRKLRLAAKLSGLIGVGTGERLSARELGSGWYVNESWRDER